MHVRKAITLIAAAALAAGLMAASPATADTPQSDTPTVITTKDASLLQANQGSAGQAYRSSPANTTDADATIDGDHAADGVSTGSDPATSPSQANADTNNDADTQTCSGANSDGIKICQTTGPAPVSLDTSSIQASPTSIVGLPDYCIHAPSGQFDYTRTDACMAYSGTLGAESVQTGAPEGNLNYVVIAYAYTVTDLNTFAYQVQIETTSASGYMADHVTTLTASALCDGKCTLDSQTFNTGVMKVGGTQSGESYFDWPVVSNTEATMFPDWALTATTAGFVSQLPTFYVGNVDVPVVRCDDFISSRAAGCVFPLSTPYISYEKSSYPTFTAHISAAQASGLPGSSASASPLRRLTNAAGIDANRNKACPSSYPRPANRSCDEYPFASTYNGASYQTAGPRTEVGCAITLTQKQSTGPNGYSVCMINASENSGAGSVLSARLYTPYRILDGDTFYVNVTAGS